MTKKPTLQVITITDAAGKPIVEWRTSSQPSPRQQAATVEALKEAVKAVANGHHVPRGCEATDAIS